MGVRTLLERHTPYQIVGEAADGEEATIKAIETKPDAILLDYSLPVVSGLNVVRQVRERLPAAKFSFSRYTIASC